MKNKLTLIFRVRFGLFLAVFIGNYGIVDARQVSVVERCARPNSNSKGTPTQLRSRGILSKNYTNVDQLINESDVIVLGTFSKNISISKISKSQSLILKNLEKKSRKSLTSSEVNKILYLRDPGHRDIEFLPLKILKGQGMKSPIIIAQRGAIGQETNVDTATPMEEDTFFQSGDTYILFLVKPLPHEILNRTFYWIAGGTQGAFCVKNQKVYSRNFLGQIPSNIGPLIQGEDLNLFLNKIQKKLAQ